MNPLTKAIRTFSTLGIRESSALLFCLLKSEDKGEAWMKFMFDYTSKRFEPIFVEMKNEKKTEQPLPKTIFFFWWDGFDSMPEIPRLCYHSLRLFFPDYEILFLDKKSIANYVSPSDIVYRHFLEKTVSVQNFSDYLRMTMIEKVGGYWVDSTLLFLQPFPMTELLIDGRTFGSAYGRNNQLWLDLGEDFLTWNSFFLAGRKDSLVAKTFLACFREHYRKKKYPYAYFMVDAILYAIRKQGIGENALRRTKFVDGDFLYAIKNDLVIHSEKEKEEWISCPQKLKWQTSLPNKTKQFVEEILQKEKRSTSL